MSASGDPDVFGFHVGQCENKAGCADDDDALEKIPVVGTEVNEAESDGGVALRTMSEMAEAMGARFVYAIVPEGGALQVDEGALLPSIFRVPIDWTELAEAGETALYDVSIYLGPDELNSDGYLATTKRKNCFRVLSRPLFETPMMLLQESADAAEDLARIEMDGVIEKVEDGHLVGWLKDNVTGEWRNAIAFYINGRFAGNIRPGTKRESIGPDALIYRFALPLEYFYERGETDLTIEARVRGRGVSLRRTPLIMTGGGRDYAWDRTALEWKPTEFDLGFDG